MRLIENVPSGSYAIAIRVHHAAIDGMGLFIAVGSYHGEMSFNVVSNSEIMPDVEFFRECLEASFEELLAAE